MIDALRRRADTHASSNRLDEPPERPSFLGLPPPYGGCLFPNSMHTNKGIMTCFFWCGHTGLDGDRDDSDDLTVGMPDYLFGRRLGQGQRGEVRHAIQRSNGESVAVKCIKRPRHGADENEESVLEEAAVLARLSHPSIVHLLAFTSLPNYHYLVLELLDGGELLGAVAGLMSYTEHDARQIAIAVLEGLAHAHEFRCVHRDLQPENLLLARDPVRSSVGELGRRVKIAGWGRAKRLPAHGLLQGEACFGMKAFSAPEMVLEDEHGTPADMYAVGAILYTLLSGSPPRMPGIIGAVSPSAPDLSGPSWACVSAEAKNLVGALMTPDGPTARLTASQALSHPWIRAGERALRLRSLDAVLKGARVLSWRDAMLAERNAELRHSASMPRVRSMF